MKSCKLKVKTRQLKRTNKSVSYPTITDIDGVEYFVMYTKYSKKFNIELCYGKIEVKKRSKPALILTEELKTMMVKNKALRAIDFEELFSATVVKKLRRRLKKNPYKSYTEWVESTDPDKPKEVTFFHTKEHTEIITDYFGIKHILFSSRIANNGIVISLGKPLDEYKYEFKQGQTTIITRELAEYIKKHLFHPHVPIRELPIASQVSKYIRKALGHDKYADEEVNMWLAGHLVEIASMTKDAFVSQYLKGMNMGKGDVIKHCRYGLHQLKIWSKSQEKEHKTLFRIVMTLNTKSTKSTTEVIEKLSIYTYREEARRCVKAYKVLTLAEEYNHPIPKEYKGIVKKKKLQ